MRTVLVALAVFCHFSGIANAADSRRPNVVVILTDDQGWGDLSLNGNPNLKTPRIDSLAKDGARFDRFYVCPVCSPTRAEFLTGRYHVRGGVWSTSTGGERLDLDERTLADAFRAAGYTNGIFGKWHNGMQYPYHPLGRGFHEHYGFCSGHWGDYFNPPLEHNGRIVQGKGFLTDDLTDHALQFLEKNAHQPFFCYLPFNTPHGPFQVPDQFFDRFNDSELKLRGNEKTPEDLAVTRAVLAMCENNDWNVGRVLDKLDELKLADNTIVVYFHDNGPQAIRWNGGMRGRKGSTDEGGVRSPLLVRWPGHISPGTVVKPISAAIDLYPTLADLTGVPLAKGKPLDGVSLAAVLTGKENFLADRKIFSHWNNKVSVRTQRHRLDADGALYDMIADPGQKSSISQQQPDLHNELRSAVAKWRTEVLRELSREPRPFPVGYRELPVAQLPARDGIPHGGVKRSASAPNCSFFTNWTKLEDKITWDVEVANDGKYDVAVYYTCPAESVGSTVELSLNGNSVRGKVSPANDPPLYGSDHDRAPRRAESLVKDFKPLSLGEIELKKGRGPLTLRAVEVVGQQVMEVRALVLTLK